MTMTLRLERIVPATPRRVFETWLDPAALAVFMTPAHGMHVSKTEVDARVGGAFLVVMSIGDRDLPHRGEYLEIERYSRLAFTWRSHAAGEHSRVVLTFEPAGDHTRLVLEHDHIADPAQIPSHDGGWSLILEALAAYVA